MTASWRITSFATLVKSYKVHTMITLFCLGVIVIVSGGSNAFAQSSEDTGLERLRNEIARLEELTGGTAGVGAVHLESGREFYFNKDVRFPMASTYKVPIAVQLLTRIEKGEIRLDDMITIQESDLHPGSGTISRLLDDPGVILSLHNLLELMLIISDNSATYLCLRAAGGPAAVTQRMREMGMVGITVNRPTFVLIANWLGVTSFDKGAVFSQERFREELGLLSEEERTRAAQSFDTDERDTSTPYAMAQLLQKIWNKEN